MKQRLNRTEHHTWGTAFMMLLLLMLPAAAQAQYLYTTNNGAITITGYTGPGGAVTIPDTINGLAVTGIGNSAFANQASLTNVAISDSVTWVADYAFTDCRNLTNATIGLNVASIGREVFGGCTNLITVSVDARNSLYSSVEGVLFDKTQTALVDYPEGKAGGYTIPETVVSIGNEAFHGCASLSNVTIPNSVTSIGVQAFKGCASLQDVKFGTGVTNIGWGAFDSCLSLASVTIADGVTSIGGWTFYGCSSLTNITIPNTVTGIFGQAFGTCTKLGSVLIPDSVTTIGEYAFDSCFSLTNLTIGESITNIGTEAFRACLSLSMITVDARNAFYCSVDGVLHNRSQTTLIQCPAGKAGSFTVPKTVTEILDHAFNYCSGLTHVYFQTNSPMLGVNVFYGATNLTNFYMPNTCCYGMTFGGRPAVLWNPRMRISDGYFGIRTNAFGFNITGTSNLVIVVEACTNLVNPTWSVIGTNLLIGRSIAGGSSYFSDPAWTNHPTRYYRLRSP